ncbi:MAG: FAD-dependent oxidoreductase [bacterium]
MKSYDYLIIGGGIAGTTAAATIRVNDTDGTIAIVEREPYLLHSRIMLSKAPYFLGKVDEGKIFMKDECWYPDNRIDLIGESEVTSIDTKAKIVKVSDDEIGYGKLLIATGACARRWPVEGADKKGVHYMRTLDEARALIADTKSAKQAVTIGGGFISFEVADLLRKANIDVTNIILEDYFWEPILDEVGGKMVEAEMEKAGVKIMRKSEVEKVIGDARVSGVELKDGTSVDCDMIVAGIGVKCELNMIAQAGLEVDHGIIADEYLKSNVDDVWIAGDVAEYRDNILGDVVIMANWANAQEQGRVAGLNMAGKNEEFKFVSFYTSQGFGLSVTFVGNVRVADDRETITRGSAEEGRYARLIIKGGELVGATLINMTPEMTTIRKLIEDNIDVSDQIDNLADSKFDINTLLHAK